MVETMAGGGGREMAGFGATTGLSRGGGGGARRGGGGGGGGRTRGGGRGRIVVVIRGAGAVGDGQGISPAGGGIAGG